MTKSVSMKARSASWLKIIVIDVHAISVAAGLIACLTLAVGGCTSAGTTRGVTTGAPSVGVYVLQNTPESGTVSTDGSILEFSPAGAGEISPVSSIRGSSGNSLEFLATDDLGDIYTSSQGASTSAIVEYTVGSSNNAVPKRSIPFNSITGLKAVSALSTDIAGNIYIANSTGGISIFNSSATGSTIPTSSFSISSGAGVEALAVDRTGNLFVATSPSAPDIAIAPIMVFPVGAIGATQSIGGSLTTMVDGSPKAMATDNAGNLYVANVVSGVSSILVFGPNATGNTPPLRNISGPDTLLGCVGGIAVDAEGYLYAVSTAVCGSTANPTVLKFSTTGDGNIAPISSFTSKAWTNADAALSIAVY